MTLHPQPFNKSNFIAKVATIVLSVTLGFFGFGLMLKAQAQALYDPGTISIITIEGNQRYSNANAFAIIPIRVGDPFDPVRIDASIKALFETGEFADVRATRSGNQLIFTVLENIVLDIIAFEGNDTVNDETLSAVLVSKTREAFTQTRVQTDVGRLLRVYQVRGMYGVHIVPKLISLGRNRANLVFEIQEGSPAKIDSIVFIGNKVFDGGRLRSEIQSRQRAPWRLFTQDDLYNPDRLAFDIRRLQTFYSGRGYADFKVISASGEQIADRSGFIVTFQVDEGQRYTFGTSKLLSEIKGLDEPALRRLIKTQQGKRYDIRKINETVEDINTAIKDQGFAFAEVRVEQDRNAATGIANITYRVKDGPRVFVERININGNDSTHDYVIRREFRLVEGDAFSASKLQRSQQRIQSLGFFSSVDIDTLPGSAADRAIIDVTVTETDTNQILFGGTISSKNGITGDLGVTFGNLGGRAQSFSVKANGGLTSQSVSMAFQEPWLFNREIPASAFASYGQNTNPNDTYNTRTFSGGISLGYKLNEHVSEDWSYTLRRSNIFNVADNAPFIIKQEVGTSWQSIIGHKISYSTLDNSRKPTEGLHLSLGTDLAGIGGDVAFVRNIATANYFIPFQDVMPIFENNSLVEQAVIALRAEAGNITGLGQDTRISNRFMYGENIVRGFSPDGLSPRCDASESNGECPNDVALGGTNYYRGTAEIRFPLPLVGEQGFDGRFFGDVGAVWDVAADTTGLVVLDSSVPRFSAGVGATWDSPFGPLSVDYGFPFNVQKGDQVQNFRFSMEAGL